MSSDWFYHAPQHRKSGDEQPQVPLMSQIPGLSDLPADDPTSRPPGVLLRDTDSEYIKLAKMGGRKNLLYFRVPGPKKEAKKYPVPEWWGYSSAAGAAEPTEDTVPNRRKPAVPDYMVYQPYREPATNQPVSRSRLPFAQDGQSQWTRDANFAHNEKRNPNIASEVDTLLKNTGLPFPKYRQLPVAGASREAEPDNLSKVLNFGYQRDWIEAREAARQQEQQRRSLYTENLKNNLAERHSASVSQLQGERDNSLAKSAAGEQTRSAVVAQSRQQGASRTTTKPWRTTTVNANHGNPPPTQSLYKPKKYQNVQSRLDTTGGIPQPQAVN